MSLFTMIFVDLNTQIVEKNVQVVKLYIIIFIPNNIIEAITRPTIGQLLYRLGDMLKSVRYMLLRSFTRSLTRVGEPSCEGSKFRDRQTRLRLASFRSQQIK